jgi:SAM-dependent methyltransferase
MVMSVSAATQTEEVIWHELECGLYSADLPLWSELASEHPGQLLDVGAGAGRVALHLAAEGHAVIALDRSPTLLRALRERADGLQVRTVCSDARAFELPEQRELSLCIVPMQTVQLLGSKQGRLEFLACARAHLRRGGLLACAVVCDVEPFDSAAEGGPAAERTRVSDLLYSTRATRVALSDSAIVLERERTVQRLGGTQRRTSREVVELDWVSPAELWSEARTVGLTPESSRLIEATDEYAGSTIVMLRA